MIQTMIHIFRSSSLFTALCKMLWLGLTLINASSIICFLKYYVFCKMHVIHASVRDHYYSQWKVSQRKMEISCFYIIHPLERRDICTELAYDLLTHLPLSASYMRQRIGSTLVQIMAVAYSAPSHYLNQCCFQLDPKEHNFPWILIKMKAILSRRKWVNNNDQLNQYSN